MTPCFHHGFVKRRSQSDSPSAQLVKLITSLHIILQLFTWEGNLQDVVSLKKRSCTLPGVTLAAPTDSPAYVNLSFPGTFFFSSSLADYCSAGQLLGVSVTANNDTSGKQRDNQLATGLATTDC